MIKTLRENAKCEFFRSSDCSNGEDEASCSQRELDKYTRTPAKRLDVSYMERWLHQTAEACALHCKNAVGFDCKSFNFHPRKKICTLSSSNIGE